MTNNSADTKHTLIKELCEQFGLETYRIVDAQTFIGELTAISGEDLDIEIQSAVHSGFLMTSNFGLVITNHALEEMSMEEVKAITLHELGHFKLGHTERESAAKTNVVVKDQLELEADAFAMKHGAQAQALISGVLKALKRSFYGVRDQLLELDLIDEDESSPDFEAMVATTPHFIIRFKALGR